MHNQPTAHIISFFSFSTNLQVMPNYLHRFLFFCFLAAPPLFTLKKIHTSSVLFLQKINFPKKCEDFYLLVNGMLFGGGTQIFGEKLATWKICVQKYHTEGRAENERHETGNIYICIITKVKIEQPNYQHCSTSMLYLYIYGYITHTYII